MTLRLLVTGGAGYVGSHAVKALVRSGHDVTVFDDLSRGHRDAVRGARLVEGDLRQPEGLREGLAGIDAVLHFAALCYVGESVHAPREYYRNNLVGTLNLLDAMLDAKVNRIVFSSTCATYGDPVEMPMTEAHPQRPVNPYGATKLAVERALADYGAAYGMASVALRYFNAAGCDAEGELGERHEPETHLIPLALREALRVRAGGDPGASALVVNGDGFDTPDGTCIRDYVHVDDLAEAHLRAAEMLARGAATVTRAYNLGTGRGHSVLEVISACRAVTGIPIAFRVGPPRPGDPARLVAGNALARAELGWQPRHASLEEIVATAWRWMSCTS